VNYIVNSAFSYCSNLNKIDVNTANTLFESRDGVLYGKNNNNKLVLMAAPGGKGGSFTVPEDVISISSSAFAGCTKLTSVTIPNSVSVIQSSTFRGCTGLTTVNIPDSVISIGSEAFSGCSSLSSLKISKYVQSLGSAFSGCKSLEIKVDPDNFYYADIDGVLFDKTLTTLLLHPGKGTSYSIPDGTFVVGQYAISSSSDITSLTIPGSVIVLENYAIQSSKLSRVTYLGKSDILEGTYPFSYSYNLKKICVTAEYTNKTFCGIPATTDCSSPQSSHQNSLSSHVAPSVTNLFVALLVVVAMLLL